MDYKLTESPLTETEVNALRDNFGFVRIVVPVNYDAIVEGMYDEFDFIKMLSELAMQDFDFVGGPQHFIVGADAAKNTLHVCIQSEVERHW